MKLTEWADATDTVITWEAGAGTYVVPRGDMPHAIRAALWGLEDYAVSTVSGPVIYLTPKNIK